MQLSKLAQKIFGCIQNKAFEIFQNWLNSLFSIIYRAFFGYIFYHCFGMKKVTELNIKTDTRQSQSRSNPPGLGRLSARLRQAAVIRISQPGQFEEHTRCAACSTGTVNCDGRGGLSIQSLALQLQGLQFHRPRDLHSTFWVTRHPHTQSVQGQQRACRLELEVHTWPGIKK